MQKKEIYIQAEREKEGKKILLHLVERNGKALLFCFFEDFEKFIT